MTSLAKFTALAERHGMSVEYSKDAGIASLEVWAPAGQTLVSSGCHCDSSLNSCTTASGNAIDWPQAYRELQIIIMRGTDPCAEQDCEHCAN